MKKMLTIAVLLGVTLSALGQDADEPQMLKEARTKYEKAVREAVAGPTKDYVTKLENLQEQCLAAFPKKQSEANAIGREIERINALVPTSATVASAEKTIIGTWEYAAGGYRQTETYTSDHRVSNGPKTGKWEIKDGKWITTWPPYPNKTTWEVALPIEKQVSGKQSDAKGVVVDFTRTKK